jgi:hypothetical protein
MRNGGGSLDIRSVCYPLEIFKKYDFLFDHFGIRNRSRGLQVVFQERPSVSPKRSPGLGDEEYAIDCGPGRVVLSAASARGQFYALSTLLQALAFYGETGCLPAFSLRDSPALDFRGVRLSGVADPSALPRLLLQLALLKFNHIALPAAAANDPSALAVLAQRMGIVILYLDPDPSAIARLAPAGQIAANPPRGPALFPDAATENTDEPAAWCDFFLGQCRSAKAGGGGLAAWSDLFLSHPEWIRRIPRDVLVLNRQTGLERGDFIRTAVLPFKEHHVHQVLCPSLCDRGRFLPDVRAALARVNAAFTAAATGKLTGVLLAGAAGEGDGCLPQGAALAFFQAGCQLWSGRPPGPAAFSRWALGRDEPDLFRVFSFLAQAEHRLSQPHNRYLFEDPQSAPFSRQGDPREVVAHFRKAALYLQKRELAAGDFSALFDFVRCLYGFIALKVEFSIRLGAPEKEALTSEALRAQAVRLAQLGAELKERYLGLWRGHSPSAALPEAALGFDFVIRRLRNIAGSNADPEGEEFLQAEPSGQPVREH